MIGAESICALFRLILLLDISISNIIPYLTGAPKEIANAGDPPGTRVKLDGLIVVRSSNDSSKVRGASEKPLSLPRKT